MGVGAEHLGKRVRCPRCNQVVVAPNTTPTAAATSPSPPPASPPASPWTGDAANGQPLPPAPEADGSKKTSPRGHVTAEDLFTFDAPPPPTAPSPSPTAAIGSPPAHLKPQPAPVPEPPQPEPAPHDSPEPVFSFPQKKEAADSILSDPDESDDEIFGSHGSNKLPIPTLPEMPAEPPPPVPQPVPVMPQPAAYAPPGQAYSQPVPVPVTVVPVMPVPIPAGVNPFSFEPAAATVLAHAPAPAAARPEPSSKQAAADTEVIEEAAEVVEELPDAAVAELPDEKPASKSRIRKPERGRATEAAGGINKGLFFGLVGYAVVMTGLAVYGVFIKSGEKLDPGHPLSTIPDSFGEFDPASRKKVSQYRFPIDGEIPESQRTALGGKIEVGQLEIEPVKVEVRRLRLIVEGKSEKREENLASAVVLHLRIKNSSPDLPIHPMDPAFNRKSRNEDKPATRLVAGKQTFFGGPITWPFATNIKRRYEAEQEADASPLKPDESREYVVFTEADPKAVKAVTEASGAILWRVQVRRGLVKFKGKDVPVTAIIGVEFTAQDVKTD